MKKENINPKDVSKSYNKERCNFLEGELKRIEAQIKTVKGYSKDDMKHQKELWTLRKEIIIEIGEIPGNTVIMQYSNIENKMGSNKNNTII